jgi:hypothetical protein
LYTDEDETIFQAQRPIILTSIEEIGAREDLLERSLIIELPTIAPGNRRAEKAFWRAFEEQRPLILGALLNVVSGALARLPEVEATPEAELSRMADFQQWGAAAEGSLGLEPGAFAAAYAANRATAMQLALESSSLIPVLLSLLRMQGGSLEGTTDSLLGRLNATAEGALHARDRSWPRQPRVLSQILRRAAPALRDRGISIEQVSKGRGNEKRKVWKIRDPHYRPPTKSAPAGKTKSAPAGKAPAGKPVGLAERMKAAGIQSNGVLREE